MSSLDAAQQSRARIGQEKTRNNALAQAFRDNLVLDHAGIRGDALTPHQREQLLALIGEYVGNTSQGHARLRMEEVADLIEFDHPAPVALEGDRGVPTRRHVHSVVRAPNGNDYGKYLLRQHHERHRGDAEYGHDY